MSIKRTFIVISAIFAASTVFADNSSVTSKKYVDDLMSGYQGKLPGSGANTLMIYDDETGIGEKSIETTLGENAIGVPTVGAVKTGLDGVQDTITGTEGYVMTGTGNPGEVGEKPIYGATTNYTDALVTAETVNTAVTNAVNSSLIRVDANGNPSDNGTLWEINTSLFALTLLPAEYIQLEYIESNGTQYIDTGIVTPDSDSTVTRFNARVAYTSNAGAARLYIGLYNNWNIAHYCEIKSGKYGVNIPAGYYSPLLTANTAYNVTMQVNGSANTSYNINVGGINYSNTVTQYQGAAMGRFYLFGEPVSNFAPSKSLRIYSAKLTIDGNVVRDLIPAQNSSGVVGMYDMVSGQFFRDGAGGNFIAGPAVVGN